MDSINRLRNTKTYLVGAMDRVPDGGVTWRNKICPTLKSLGVKILDPCKKPVENSLEDDYTRQWIEYYKETGQYDKIKKNYAIIRSADLRCVDVSDFIIAHIDLNVHACGTYEEIVTANRQKKPVLVWCEQGKSKAPNWLFFMLPHQHIFGDCGSLINYLGHVDSISNINDFGRWVFFSNQG
jgi:hypothetical protein